MKNIKQFLVTTFLIFASLMGYAQFQIPEKPSFETAVYDYAKMLSETEKAQLEQKLVRYSDSTTTQIVVVTIDNLKGEDVGVVATNWAQQWGIGDAAKDNGVILLFSLEDKKMTIRPGYGVEDRLIAGVCGEIIRKIIRPEFKAGNYFVGIDKGTDAVFQALNGKFKGTRQEKPTGGIPVWMIAIGLLILFFIISKSKNNGKNGGQSGGGFDLADIIILSSLGRNSGGGSFGGGFGGSGGGGGFGGGFGGGGFSGGGASGDW